MTAPTGNAAYESCDLHDEPLIVEAGGPDMPTVHGRLYCPKCQASLMRGLDDSAAGRTVYLGSFAEYVTPPSAPTTSDPGGSSPSGSDD